MRRNGPFFIIIAVLALFFLFGTRLGCGGCHGFHHFHFPGLLVLLAIGALFLYFRRGNCRRR